MGPKSLIYKTLWVSFDQNVRKSLGITFDVIVQLIDSIVNIRLGLLMMTSFLINTNQLFKPAVCPCCQARLQDSLTVFEITSHQWKSLFFVTFFSTGYTQGHRSLLHQGTEVKRFGDFWPSFEPDCRPLLWKHVKNCENTV